jgi:hypothetical protein
VALRNVAHCRSLFCFRAGVINAFCLLRMVVPHQDASLRAPLARVDTRWGAFAGHPRLK